MILGTILYMMKIIVIVTLELILIKYIYEMTKTYINNFRSKRLNFNTVIGFLAGSLVCLAIIYGFIWVITFMIKIL